MKNRAGCNCTLHGLPGYRLIVYAGLFCLYTVLGSILRVLYCTVLYCTWFNSIQFNNKNNRLRAHASRFNIQYSQAHLSNDVDVSRREDLEQRLGRYQKRGTGFDCYELAPGHGPLPHLKSTKRARMKKHLTENSRNRSCVSFAISC